jgi:hypothetical protein
MKAVSPRGVIADGFGVGKGSLKRLCGGRKVRNVDWGIPVFGKGYKSKLFIVEGNLNRERDIATRGLAAEQP